MTLVHNSLYRFGDTYDQTKSKKFYSWLKLKSDNKALEKYVKMKIAEDLHTEHPKCFVKADNSVKKPNPKELLVSGAKLMNFMDQTFKDFKTMYLKEMKEK